MKVEVIEIVKKMIIQVMQKYVDENTLNEIQTALSSIPIEMGDKVDNYLHLRKARAEYATKREGSVILLPSDISTNIDDIATILHELAHYFSRKIAINTVGPLKMNTFIEEAMAVHFSEFILNEYMKDCIDNKKEIDITIPSQIREKGFEESKDIYPDERKIINTIMLILSNDNKDITLMVNYLFGDKSKTKDILGNELSQIIDIIEMYIKKYNYRPDGWGFNNEELIHIIYKKIEKILIKKQQEIDISQFSNNTGTDLKERKQRYYELGEIIKNQQIIEKIAASKESLLTELSMKYHIPVEILRDSLTSIDLFYIINNPYQEQLINFIISWHQQTGYTMQELIQYGFTEQEIYLLTSKNKQKEEVKIEIEMKKRNIDFSLDHLYTFGILINEIEEYLKSDNPKEIIEKKVIENITIGIIKTRYIPCYSNCTYEYMAEKIRDDMKNYLLEKDFNEEEIVGIVDKALKNEKEQSIFLKKMGYSIPELLDLGFTMEEISPIIRKKYDGVTGEKIDRELVLQKAIMMKEQEAQEFEEETGKTYEELRSLGFSNREIRTFTNCYSTSTGERLDRKEVVQRAIEQKQGVSHK